MFYFYGVDDGGLVYTNRAELFVSRTDGINLTVFGPSLLAPG